VVAFSAALDSSANGSGAITLSGGAGAQSATLTVGGNQATLAPSWILEPLTTYTLTVTTGVRGASGQSLQSSVVTHFTTGSGWSTPQQIDDNMNSDGGWTNGQRLAFTPDGGAMVVWVRTLYSGDSSLFASRYTLAIGWDSPQQISSSAAAESPLIALDGNGNAMTVWIDSIQNAKSSMFANRYSAASATWGTAQPLEIGLHDVQSLALGMDSHGNATAAWTDFGTGLTGEPQLFVDQYSLASGWDSPQQITHNDPLESGCPQVGYDPAGNATIVWQENPLPPDSIYIDFTRYAAATRTWAAPQPIPPPPDNELLQSCPELGGDSRGNFLVVWSGGPVDGPGEVFADYFSATAGWAGPQMTHLPPSNEPGGMQVAMNANGIALAVSAVRSTPTVAHIYASRFTPDMGWDAAAVQIDNASDVYANGPVIALDSQGNAWAVWSTSSTSTGSIYAARYTSGVGWSTPQALATDISVYAPPQVTIDANGNAFVVWSAIVAPVPTDTGLFVARFD
jgi:hypothetical protein